MKTFDKIKIAFLAVIFTVLFIAILIAFSVITSVISFAFMASFIFMGVYGVLLLIKDERENT